MKKAEKSKEVSGAIKALRLIKEKEGSKKGVAGSVPCPECGGDFRYSIVSSNGHVNGRCSCCGLGFMQ